MPSLTSGERVQAIMRWLYNHPDDKHTYQSLSHALDIPGSSIRKTVTFNYPKCFIRRWEDHGITLPEPIVWPDGNEFELGWGPDEVSLSEIINESPQLTIEQERAAWAEEKAQLLRIIEAQAGNPKAPSRKVQGDPAKVFQEKWPSKAFYEKGKATLDEYPSLKTAMMAAIKSGSANKDTYYHVWNLAIHMLTTLKAREAKEGMQAYLEGNLK